MYCMLGKEGRVGWRVFLCIILWVFPLVSLDILVYTLKTSTETEYKKGFSVYFKDNNYFFCQSVCSMCHIIMKGMSECGLQTFLSLLSDTCNHLLTAGMAQPKCTRGASSMWAYCTLHCTDQFQCSSIENESSISTLSLAPRLWFVCLLASTHNSSSTLLKAISTLLRQ